MEHVHPLLADALGVAADPLSALKVCKLLNGLCVLESIYLAPVRGAVE